MLLHSWLTSSSIWDLQLNGDVLVVDWTRRHIIWCQSPTQSFWVLIRHQLSFISGHSSLQPQWWRVCCPSTANTASTKWRMYTTVYSGTLMISYACRCKLPYASSSCPSRTTWSAAMAGWNGLYRGLSTLYITAQWTLSTTENCSLLKLYDVHHYSLYIT